MNSSFAFCAKYNMIKLTTTNLKINAKIVFTKIFWARVNYVEYLQFEFNSKILCNLRRCAAVFKYLGGIQMLMLIVQRNDKRLYVPGYL